MTSRSPEQEKDRHAQAHEPWENRAARLMITDRTIFDTLRVISRWWASPGGQALMLMALSKVEALPLTSYRAGLLLKAVRAFHRRSVHDQRRDPGIPGQAGVDACDQ